MSLDDNSLELMPPTVRHFILSVLFFQEDDQWIAQALEHDLAAHGATLADAKVAFERTLAGYFELAKQHHQEPLATLKPAPAEFWEAWKRVVRRNVEVEQVPSIDAYMVPAVSHEPISRVQ